MHPALGGRLFFPFENEDLRFWDAQAPHQWLGASARLTKSERSQDRVWLMLSFVPYSQASWLSGYIGARQRQALNSPWGVSMQGHSQGWCLDCRCVGLLTLAQGLEEGTCLLLRGGQDALTSKLLAQ